MKSNNKFGKCCNCPALMSDSRLFTNWETSKTYNYKLGVKLNTNTNTKYRNILRTNPEYIINEFNDKIIECNKNSGFYIDTTLHHQKFTDNIINEMYKDYTVRPFMSLEYADN
jgi:hypothetical protein